MMGRHWSFRVQGETLALVPREAAALFGAGTRVPSVEAAFAIQFIGTTVQTMDAVVKRDLAQLLANIAHPGASRATLDELCRAVAAAVRSERVLAFRTARPTSIERAVKIEPLGWEDMPSEEIDVYVLAAEVTLIGGTPLIRHRVRILDAETGEVVVDSLMTDGHGIVRAEVPKQKDYRIEIVDLDCALSHPPHVEESGAGVLRCHFVDEGGAPFAHQTIAAKQGDDELELHTDEDGLIEVPAPLGHYVLKVGDQTFDAHALLIGDLERDEHLYRFVVAGVADDSPADQPQNRMERFDESANEDPVWHDDALGDLDDLDVGGLAV
jgi:hypothetical protein